ncbi:MAG: NUMOD4 motif-containing HNH endonuclease [Bacteroidaceae bacterium]|nr:NUMOD4 motif-containing HNH endonuclease [Bacteroidaceae bacterium]
MNQTEKWKPVEGFPRYEVSNMGRVRSNCCKNGRKLRYLLKPRSRPKGYYSVTLSKKNSETGRVYFSQKQVHRLVAHAFLGQCPQGYVVDHINGDSLDNRLENLRYASLSENRRCTHTERFKGGFRIEVFRDGKFLAEVNSRKALLGIIGQKSKFKNSTGGLSLNRIFGNGRTWRYKNYYAILVLPLDDVEPGAAPHVQFRLDF